MENLPEGVYENLLTARLHGLVDAAGTERAQVAALDPADAHEALTRHITELTRRALRV